MNKKLYVGNLPFTAQESELQQFFEQAGPVTSVRILTDRETGRSRGFGFVEMQTEEGAQAAIDRLNGQSFAGRNLTVTEAREQQPRSGGFGGGGGRGPRGGGFGGGGGGGRDRGPRY